MMQESLRPQKGSFRLWEEPFLHGAFEPFNSKINKIPVSTTFILRSAGYRKTSPDYPSGE